MICAHVRSGSPKAASLHVRCAFLMFSLGFICDIRGLFKKDALLQVVTLLRRASHQQHEQVQKAEHVCNPNYFD